jgi:amino acid transporter
MSPTAKPIRQTRLNILNAAALLILISGLLVSFFILSSSWIKYTLMATAVICGLVYLATRRRPRIRRVVRNTLVPVMIFALCFASVEVYLFWNAGYPPTYSADPKATLTTQSMLNASVVELVQKIEQSPAFSLLKLEHSDKIKFYQMSLDAWRSGSIRVDFVTEDGTYLFQFSSSNGNQYRLSILPHRGPLINYKSADAAAQTLIQIDSLGLNWYYNQAIAIAENRTADLPTIDSLTVNLAVGDEGLSVQVIGYQVTVNESGGVNGHGVLISSFEPNGDLRYMSEPGQNT